MPRRVILTSTVYDFSLYKRDPNSQSENAPTYIRFDTTDERLDRFISLAGHKLNIIEGKLEQNA